jgi:hypothetical protein
LEKRERQSRSELHLQSSSLERSWARPREEQRVAHWDCEWENDLAQRSESRPQEQRWGHWDWQWARRSAQSRDQQKGRRWEKKKDSPWDRTKAQSRDRSREKKWERCWEGEWEGEWEESLDTRSEWDGRRWRDRGLAPWSGAWLEHSEVSQSGRRLGCEGTQDGRWGSEWGKQTDGESARQREEKRG